MIGISKINTNNQIRKMITLFFLCPGGALGAAVPQFGQYLLISPILRLHFGQRIYF
jgi:hypothetical protein